MPTLMRKKNKKNEIRHNEKLRAIAIAIIVIALLLILKPTNIDNTNTNLTTLTNRTNALYGIPNPNSYVLFMNMGPNSNKSHSVCCNG